jgi:hypothetical protein
VEDVLAVPVLYEESKTAYLSQHGAGAAVVYKGNDNLPVEVPEVVIFI